MVRIEKKIRYQDREENNTKREYKRTREKDNMKIVGGK